jgi:hypothetical protein
MSYFAITNRDGGLKIEACHISLWALARPWYCAWRLSYFFDVGVRLRSEHPVDHIRVALPFDSGRGGITDLSKIVLDPDFSPLIFGRPVLINGNSVKYDGTSLGQGTIDDVVIPVRATDSKQESETERDTNFSIWTITLQQSMESSRSYYIRFRVPVSRPGRLWISKGWGFAKRGVITDFRINDIRESLLLGEGRSEAKFIKAIDRVFIFLVAPSSYIPKHVSPPLHYSRLLEPRVWRSYLASCGNYATHTKFTIHEWRSSGEQVVSVESPFRTYADLTHDFGFQLFILYVVGGLVAPILFLISNTWIVPLVVRVWKVLFGL